MAPVRPTRARQLVGMVALAALFLVLFLRATISHSEDDNKNVKNYVRESHYGAKMRHKNDWQFPEDETVLAKQPNHLVGASQCPEYSRYASIPHRPLSEGPLRLPFQRPSVECRTFHSDSVEKTIEDMKKKISDPDLARLFENCFPNTLDTTIAWHVNSSVDRVPQTFVVTGDINAEWLRDSHRQLQPYQKLAKDDVALRELILGAINTQVEMVIAAPYCNAFNPPRGSGLTSPPHNTRDAIRPRVNHKTVFECKYELDSVASFLGLSNDFYRATGNNSFVNERWILAVETVLQLMQEQSIPTYGENGLGTALASKYSFQRETTIGSETLNLGGSGNPVNANTSLIRSAFRPSDDATIYQLFIPANAQQSVELARTAELLAASGNPVLAKTLRDWSGTLRQAIFEHGVYENKVFGKVFAYEIDGFGGITNMDDANIPSLLSLPDLGFLDKNDPIYLNTRRMILSKQGNPYYLRGNWFYGIGGPHIGTRNVWPMSHLVAIRTTDDESEMEELLDVIKKSTAGLGLMHESVNVDIPFSYTRSWFAWANSEFAKTIFDVAERKPHLIFYDDPVRQEDKPK